MAFSPPSAPADCVVATIDGAARGNPGPAAYGVLFEDARGKLLAQLARRVGKTTNNVAEYRALLAALAYARQHGWRALKVRTDSELLARQLQGDYRVRSGDLRPLYEQARQLIAALDYFAVEAVPRKLARPADRLANAALDGRPLPSGRRPVSSPQPKKQKFGRGAEFTPPRAGHPRSRSTIRAVYEGGVLRPQEPLPLADGEEVELTLHRPSRR